MNPYSSSGCSRCCTYGSKEQQVAAAEYLVELEETASVARRLEARILRKVAAALDEGFVLGWHSMGGPQDGDSTPDSFDSEKAAKHLEAEAERLDPEDKPR